MLRDVIAAAQYVRAARLARGDTPRDLAGQCAITSMLLAEALGDVHAFRTGFFMKVTTFLGKRGRYPHVHAWCTVDDVIVDATATQFGKYPAIHVVPRALATSYIETADGMQAVREVMRAWRGKEDPEYRRIHRRLRAL